MSGVAATTVPVMIAIRNSAFMRHRHLLPAQTEIHEQIGRQQIEQQQALEQAGDGRRQLQTELHRFAAEVEQRHQQRREHDAERMQSSDEGHDDRREAVARER